MMHQLEINVEIGGEAKKNAKGGDKTAEVAAGKFLAASKIRESFTLNFESLFLDMFTEMPVAKADRPEASRPAERIEAPRPVETRAEAPRVEAARPVEAPRAVEAPRPVETAANAPRAEEAADAATDDANRNAEAAERPRAEKPRRADESDGREQTGEMTTHLRALKVELSVKLQEALGAEKLDGLKKKIENLLQDENLDLETLLASVAEILGAIVGPVEAAAVVDEAAELNARDLSKLLRKALKELASAMETGPRAETAAVATEETPRAVEAKVEDLFARLLQKMDRKVTREDQEAAKNLDRPATETAETRETRDERPIEAPKLVAAKREAARVETPRELETRVADDARHRPVETGLEAAVAEAARGKARAAQNAGPAPVVVTGVAETARAAKPAEGGQNLFWQNSYNQSASQKGTAETARSARNQEAPRPQQNQIFDQIIQQAKFQLQNGRSEATIRLKPEFLGKVEMKITVEDGKVNVRFTAENAAVRSAMAENVQDLRKNLAEIGLEVEDVSILLAGEFAGADTRDENDGESGENPRTFGRYAEEDEEAETFEEIQTVIEDGSTVRYVA